MQHNTTKSVIDMLKQTVSLVIAAEEELLQAVTARVEAARKHVGSSRTAFISFFFIFRVCMLGSMLDFHDINPDLDRPHQKSQNCIHVINLCLKINTRIAFDRQGGHHNAGFAL